MRSKYFFLFFVALFSLIFSSPSILFGQISEEMELHGTVKDEDGIPLEGATVYIVGTSSGVVTGPTGEYSIAITANDIVHVRVTFIGYSSAEAEIEMSGGMRHDFILSRSDIMAGEVVINATRAGERTPQTYTTIGQEIIKRQHTGMDMPFLLSFDSFIGRDI